MCDGTVFQVTDGTTAYTPQITAPASCGTPTAHDASPTNLTGDYDYKMTYYSSTWGQESPSSPATSVVKPRGGHVDFATIPSSSDARVDYKRIYRRKVSAGEVLWHRVAEITDATTTLADSVLDNDADLTLVAPLSTTASGPIPRYLAYQGGVMFAAGMTANPTRLYYSLANQPWSLYDYLDFGTGYDTDRITGLHAFQGVLAVFKERSIWILSGNSSDTFYRRKVVPGIGCRSHHSIVEVDDLLYFLGEDGFYAFDGTDARKISDLFNVPDPIGPDMRTRVHDRDRYCVGVHDYSNGAVLWTYTQSGSTNNKVYAWFHQASKRVGSPVWCQWDLGEVMMMALISDPTSHQRLVAYGFGTGRIGNPSGNSDNGSAIVFDWKTGKLDAGLPENWKICQEFTAEFTDQAATSNMDIKYYLDGGSATTLVTHNQTDPICRRCINHSCQDIQLEFYQSSTTPSEVIGWTLEMIRAGRL